MHADTPCPTSWTWGRSVRGHQSAITKADEKTATLRGQISDAIRFSLVARNLCRSPEEQMPETATPFSGTVTRLRLCCRGEELQRRCAESRCAAGDAPKPTKTTCQGIELGGTADDKAVRIERNSRGARVSSSPRVRGEEGEAHADVGVGCRGCGRG